MRQRALKYLLSLAAFLMLHAIGANAQFKDEAFRQNYNDTTYKT